MKKEQDPGEDEELETPEEEEAPEAADEPYAGDESTEDEDQPDDATAAAEDVGVESQEPEEAPAASKPRRRRAAEVTAGRAAPKRAPRPAGEHIEVRAQAKYVRTAPRKARLVIDHIRGKSVDDARAMLQHTPRAAAVDVLKLLNSCVANAENNHELLADELRIHRAYVDEGPTLKRYRPRALGRATRIRKRTSHMTITLTPKE